MATGTPASGGRGFICGDECVDFIGLGVGAFGGESQIGVECGILCVDAFEEVGGEFARGGFFRGEGSRTEEMVQFSAMVAAFLTPMAEMRPYFSLVVHCRKRLTSESGFRQNQG